MRISSQLLLAAALLPGAALATPINLVQNPGFEAGYEHWQSRHFSLGLYPIWAHSEPGAARMHYCWDLSCIDQLDKGAFIGQHLATTPGDSYELSFWVLGAAQGVSGFSVFWDGAMIYQSTTPAGASQQYAFSGLTASSGSTLLQVHGYNTHPRHVGFDDFLVANMAAPAEKATPVSEPGVLPLIVAGLAAFILSGRRRGRR